MKTLDKDNIRENLTDKNIIKWYKKLSNLENNNKDSHLESFDQTNLLLGSSFMVPSTPQFADRSLTQNIGKFKHICTCKRKISVTRTNLNNKKKIRQRSGREFIPNPKWFFSKALNIWIRQEIYISCFKIKYDKPLSIIVKLLLTTFNNKYLYHAIDDILYSFKLNLREQENILAILYLPTLALQNNLFIDFFDIWISKIDISEIAKRNKFLKKNSQNIETSSYITITFMYKKKSPSKKQESLW